MGNPGKRVQVLVEGQQVHDFYAEEIQSSESSGMLILHARRWGGPSNLRNPDNPYFTAIEGPTGTVLDGVTNAV